MARKIRVPKITTHKDAARIADDIRTLRKAVTDAEERARAYAAALADWMREHGEKEIVSEGNPTLRLIEKVSGYEWDLSKATREDLDLLQTYGLLTVRKGQYDEALVEHGPLGLLHKYATAQYREELRFDRETRREIHAQQK